MAQRKVKSFIYRKKFFNGAVLFFVTIMIGIGSFYHLACQWMHTTSCWSKQKINELINPTVFSFEIEQVYSLPLRQKMIKFLQDEVRQVNLLFFHPHDFYSNIKKNFDIIKNFSWKRVSIDMVRFTLVGVQPCYVLNEQYVVADDKKIYDNVWFNRYPLAELPHCSVDHSIVQKKELSSNLFLFLGQVPAEVWQAFSLTYQGPEKIILKPKKWLSSATLLVTEKTLLDRDKRQSAISIFYDLCAKKLVSEKKAFEGKSLLTFDMRFNNRVVVKICEQKRVRRGA